MFQEDDGRSSGGSSPESTGSVETSISSHFGGMNYPSLFSSKPPSYGASQQTVPFFIYYIVAIFFYTTSVILDLAMQVSYL
jgi:hypothetical protein